MYKGGGDPQTGWEAGGAPGGLWATQVRGRMQGGGSTEPWICGSLSPTFVSKEVIRFACKHLHSTNKPFPLPWGKAMEKEAEEARTSSAEEGCVHGPPPPSALQPRAALSSPLDVNRHNTHPLSKMLVKSCKDFQISLQELHASKDLKSGPCLGNTKT